MNEQPLRWYVRNRVKLLSYSTNTSNWPLQVSSQQCGCWLNTKPGLEWSFCPAVIWLVTGWSGMAAITASAVLWSFKRRFTKLSQLEKATSSVLNVRVLVGHGRVVGRTLLLSYYLGHPFSLSELLPSWLWCSLSCNRRFKPISPWLWNLRKSLFEALLSSPAPRSDTLSWNTAADGGCWRVWSILLCVSVHCSVQTQ